MLAALLIVLCASIVWLQWLRIDDASVRWQILLQFTLPMMLTAIIVGASLSASAAALQVLLANPLADPGIIGISSGASLVAAVVLLSGATLPFVEIQYALPLACFVGALASTALIYRIAKHLQSAPVAVVLAGIAISTLTGAVVSWLYYFADAQSLRNLTFWLMGSLYQSDWLLLSASIPLSVIAVGYIGLKGSQLNRLFLGANTALASGVDTHLLNQRLILACAVAVGVAVSLAGSIAFIGLLVPHFVRLWVGHDNRFVIPLSALFGSVLLLFIGLLTELWAVTTFPVSMLTATIGGPLFIYALVKGQFRAH